MAHLLQSREPLTKSGVERKMSAILRCSSMLQSMPSRLVGLMSPAENCAAPELDREGRLGQETYVRFIAFICFNLV